MRTIALIFAVLFMPCWVHAAGELTPFRVEETRSLAIEPDSIGRNPDALKVTLSLHGSAGAANTQYGDLKLEQAVDDKGTNLIPGKDAFGEAAKFKDFSNAFFRKFDLEQGKTAADPQVEIELSKSARGAAKIAHLKGTIGLAQPGAGKTVEVKNVGALAGAKIELPAAAGVQITATHKPGSISPEGIELQISGKKDNIQSIDVVDGAGNSISSGEMNSDDGSGVEDRTISLKSPPDGGTKLVIKLDYEKKITRVGFDLKDVALP